MQWREGKNLDDMTKTKAPSMKEELANLFREVMNFRSSVPFGGTPRTNRLWWSWNLFFLHSQLVK